MPSGFSRVPVDLVQTCVRAGVGAPALYVLLLLLRYQEEDENGRVCGWMPRKTMSETLGYTEDYIRKLVKELRRKGIIAVRKCGHNGSATVYYLDAYREGNAAPPSDSGKGGTTGYPLESRGYKSAPVGGTTGYPPLEDYKSSSGNSLPTDNPDQSAAVPRGFEAAQPSEQSDPWDVDSEDAVNAYIDGRYANGR